MDKAWVHVLPLSIRLSVSPRRVTGLHPLTKFGSTLCLSPPDSACLLTESRPRTTGQGLGPRFASLHQARSVYSPNRRLAPQDKAWVHALPLSSKLSASPCQVAGSHRRRRFRSTHCISPPGSACLLAESWARTAGQGLGPRFDSLHMAQHISMPSRWLASKNEAWVHAMPLSSKLSASP